MPRPSTRTKECEPNNMSQSGSTQENIKGGRLIVKILDLRPYLILRDTPRGLVNEFWVKIQRELRRRESCPGRRFPQRTLSRGVNSPHAGREIWDPVKSRQILGSSIEFGILAENRSVSPHREALGATKWHGARCPHHACIPRAAAANAPQGGHHAAKTDATWRQLACGPIRVA